MYDAIQYIGIIKDICLPAASITPLDITSNKPYGLPYSYTKYPTDAARRAYTKYRSYPVQAPA